MLIGNFISDQGFNRIKALDWYAHRAMKVKAELKMKVVVVVIWLSCFGVKQQQQQTMKELVDKLNWKLLNLIERKKGELYESRPWLTRLSDYLWPAFAACNKTFLFSVLGGQTRNNCCVCVTPFVRASELV